MPNHAPFVLYTRKNKAGKKVYYCRFQDENGKGIKTISTGKTRKGEAQDVAREVLASGVIAESKNPDALEYLRGFWQRDSAYARWRALHGGPLSEKYLSTSRETLKHFEACLTGKKLLDIDRDLLEAAILELSSQGVGARTINLGLEAIKRPYRYFIDKYNLADTLAKVKPIDEHKRERGVLTGDELAAVLALQDEEPRIRCAVALGAMCGLRLGEIRGLLLEDVDADKGVLNIRHNYVTHAEGIKKPKCDSSRMVPLPLVVLELITEAVKNNTGGAYVIYQANPARPCESKIITLGFYRCLRKIGIDNDERKRRNLVFHGLRHTYVSISRAAGLSDFIVQKMSGHKSSSMMDNYSHADIIDFDDARRKLERQLTKKPEEAAREETGGA